MSPPHKESLYHILVGALPHKLPLSYGWTLPLVMSQIETFWLNFAFAVKNKFSFPLTDVDGSQSSPLFTHKDG